MCEMNREPEQKIPRCNIMMKSYDLFRRALNIKVYINNINSSMIP